jgi:hypothetical protein
MHELKSTDQAHVYTQNDYSAKKVRSDYKGSPQRSYKFTERKISSQLAAVIIRRG